MLHDSLVKNGRIVFYVFSIEEVFEFTSSELYFVIRYITPLFWTNANFRCYFAEFILAHSSRREATMNVFSMNSLGSDFRSPSVSGTLTSSLRIERELLPIARQREGGRATLRFLVLTAQYASPRVGTQLTELIREIGSGG